MKRKCQAAWKKYNEWFRQIRLRILFGLHIGDFIELVSGGCGFECHSCKGHRGEIIRVGKATIGIRFDDGRSCSSINPSSVKKYERHY